MSAMRDELKKISICASIGFILGLIYGIYRGNQNGYSWIVVAAPFMGALYIIGVVYGATKMSKMLSAFAKVMGTATKVFFSIMLRGGCILILICIIAIIMVGYFVLCAFLAVCWIPGIFVAIKALLNANSKSSSSSYSTHDGWSDNCFGDTSGSGEPKLKGSKSKKGNSKSEDEWNW